MFDRESSLLDSVDKRLVRQQSALADGHGSPCPVPKRKGKLLRSLKRLFFLGSRPDFSADCTVTAGVTYYAQATSPKLPSQSRGQLFGSVNQLVLPACYLSDAQTSLREPSDGSVHFGLHAGAMSSGSGPVASSGFATASSAPADFQCNDRSQRGQLLSLRKATGASARVDKASSLSPFDSVKSHAARSLSAATCGVSLPSPVPPCASQPSHNPEETCSPRSVASPFIVESSEDSACGRGLRGPSPASLSRTESPVSGVSGPPSLPSTSNSASLSSPPPQHYRPPPPQAAPHAPAPTATTNTHHATPTATNTTAPSHPSNLLALNPALPPGMRRPTWSLEDYAVTRRLYKAASSSVYKATCRCSGLPVALKIYFLSRVPPNTLHMVRREVELHAGLVHPGVVQLYGAFLDGSRLVLVQEYAARGDLYQLLRHVGGRMSEAQVTEVVLRPFLDALAYLHSRGICHRDIKPENLLLTESYAIKIADFGVSIDMNAERAVTRAGTPDYMAPEVSRCPLKADPADNKHNPDLAYTPAVDVWAAGVLAYELLVGFTPVIAPPAQSPPRHPYGHGHGHGQHQPHQDGVRAFLAAEATTRALHFPASLSPACRAFIRAALAEDPSERPTAQQLAQHEWIVAAAAAAQ